MYNKHFSLTHNHTIHVWRRTLGITAREVTIKRDLHCHYSADCAFCFRSVDILCVLIRAMVKNAPILGDIFIVK